MQGFKPSNYNATFKATASRGAYRNKTTLQPRGGKSMK